jgi:hypothetical protein
MISNSIVKALTLLLFLLLTNCNQTKTIKKQETPSPLGISTTISDSYKKQFKTPEALLDYYYNAISRGDIEQIAICFGQKSTYGLNFKTLSGINYKIISKKESHDSVYSHVIDGYFRPELEGIWMHPDLFITAKDSIDFIPGHALFYFWVGKFKGSWIIMSHSSEFESQMDKDIMNANDSLPTNIDDLLKK